MPGLRQPAPGTVHQGFSAGPTLNRGGATVGGISVPSVARSAGPSRVAAGWLDFSQVPAWRMAYVVGAAAYLGIFHFSLPGGLATVGRVGGAMPHGHGMAVALYFGSWLVLLTAAKDVVAYAWPHNPAAAALHQSL